MAQRVIEAADTELYFFVVQVEKSGRMCYNKSISTKEDGWHENSAFRAGAGRVPDAGRI